MQHKRIFQFSILIVAIALLAAAIYFLSQKDSPLYKPIEGYQLTTPLQELSGVDVDKVIHPYLGHSFWDMPLDKLQADLTRMDWVESAEVKRQWPNQLYITIKEQVPVARWNENGLINGAGEVFFPADISEFTNLVLLEGKLEASAQILAELVNLQQELSIVGMTVAKVSLHDQVWRIDVLDGPEIIVDDMNHRAKINRFVRALPKIDKALRKSAQVYDLRYSNGFIVANH